MIDVKEYTKRLEAFLAYRGIEKIEFPLPRSSPDNDRYYSAMTVAEEDEPNFESLYWFPATEALARNFDKSPNPRYFRAGVFYKNDTDIVIATQTDDNPVLTRETW
jgi:hypothetical protein